MNQNQREFRLTVFDIPDIRRGVGLAMALETPGGGCWLVDAGSGYPRGDGWEGGVNAGRDIIAPWLERRGVRRLDGVVISHAHYDHFGGLLWLAGHVPIDRLVDSGYEFAGRRDAHYARELADYLEIRRRFQARPGAYRAATAGQRLDLDPDLTVEVVSPPPGFYREEHAEKRPARNPMAHYMLNANSLILRIRHGAVAFLLAGDIESEDQRSLLLPAVSPEKLRCQVLAAPGHGLHTSAEFAAAARPAVVIASCFIRWLGACTAVPVFSGLGAEVFVTGRDGDITVISDGRSVRVESGCGR